MNGRWDESYRALQGRVALVARVEAGLMTSDEAEAKARENRWRPLAGEPDPAKFDPRKEHDWTLPMAIAWIASGNIDEVQFQWDKYRTAFRTWSAPQVGDWPNRKVMASFLESHAPARVAEMRSRRVGEKVLAIDPTLSRHQHGMQVRQILGGDEHWLVRAKDALWAALGAGDEVEAWGVEGKTGIRVKIPSEQWRDLEDVSKHGQPTILRTKQYPSMSYDDVVLSAKSVLNWKRPLPTDLQFAEELFRTRVRNWPLGTRTPKSKEDEDFLQIGVIGLSREGARDVRRKIAHQEGRPDWVREGKRPVKRP